jgi:hypothetical protein
MKAKIFTAAVVSIGLSFSSTAATASACQAGQPGCVLPIPEGTVAAPGQTTAPGVFMEDRRTGFPLLAVLAGIALAAIAVWLATRGDRDDRPVSP